MNRITYPLKPQMKRPTVGDLQAALQLLGYTINEAERSAGRYGAATRDMVRKLQTEHHLSVTGVVDEATASLLNRLLGERGVLDAEVTYQVKGVVRTADGAPASGFTVRAFDRDVSREMLLGTAVTGQEGGYRISFGEEQFKASSAERGGPEVFIRVADKTGKQLGQSKTVKDAPPELGLDLVLPPDPVSNLVVHGRVVTADGKPASNVLIKVFDRNIGIDDVVLGQADLDTCGQYSITYAREQLLGKPAADLVVAAYAKGNETPLYTSDVIFSAAADVVHDVVLPAAAIPETPVVAEFESLSARIAALRRVPSRLGKLQDKDIEFLSRKAQIDSVKLRRLADSDRLADGDPILARFYYALLADGQATEPEAILARDRASITRALEGATAAHLIAEIGKTDLERIVVEELPKRRGQNLLEPAPATRPASLGDLLDTLPETNSLGKDEQLAFAIRYGQHGNTPALWQAAQADTYSAKIPALQRTLALAEVTQGHGALVRVLQQDHDPNDPGSIAYLAKLARRDWLELALENGAPAESVQSAVEYGFALERIVERRFPMAVLRERLANGEIKIRNFPAEAVVKLLSEHPDFDPANERVDAFLERVGARTDDLSKALRGVQRVLPLAGALRPTAALLDAGLDSALAISRAGPNAVVACLGNEVDDTEAQAIYSRCHDVTMTNTALVSRYSPLYNRHVIPAIPYSKTSTAFLNKYPNLRALFGDLDYCSCRHCQSILGPAAYLTDLLNFLKSNGRRLNAGGPLPLPANLSHAFLGLGLRRPDLASLLLTCENTNIEIPYIDLVLEVLENTIALPVIETVATDRSAELITALTNNEVPREIRDTLAKTAITIGDELKVSALDETTFWDLWTLVPAGRTDLLLSFVKGSGLPAKLVSIDDGARRWIAGYLPKLRWSGIGPGSADVDALLEEDLKQGRIPAALVQEVERHFGLPATASVTPLEVPEGSLPIPVSVACEMSISLGIDLVLPKVTGALRKLTVKLLRPDGAVLRNVQVSKLSLDLIEKWLRGQLRGDIYRQPVMSLLQLPVLPWEVSWDEASQHWQLRHEVFRMPLYVTEAVRIVYSLTYRCSSIQNDLAAVPENCNPLAYEALRKARFPWTLPLDLWLEEVRAYLQELGVTRQRLMEIAGVPRHSLVYAREVLGLSVADGDIIGEYERAPWEAWGLEKSHWPGALKRVSTILKQSGLSFRELLDVRQTGPDSLAWPSITPAGECHPDRMEWGAPDQDCAEETLAWIHTFTHLWRKTGWTMRDLNRVLRAVPRNGPELSSDKDLCALALMARLRTELNKPILQVAAMLGAIELTPWVDHLTEGEPASASLYERVFQCTALRPSASFGSFVLDSQRTELRYLRSAEPPDPSLKVQKLSDHAAFLAAALGIAALEVEQLITFLSAHLTGPNTNDLSVFADELKLANLATLAGAASCCRSLRVGANDFIRWTRHLGNPYKRASLIDRATDLLAFVDGISFARRYGTSLDEFDYLLRHDLQGEFVDTEARLRSALAELRDALRNGTLLGDITPENLCVQLAKLKANDRLLAAIRDKGAARTVLHAEVPIQAPPSGSLPDLPEALASLFSYERMNDGTVWLGCQGIVSDDDFKRLPNGLDQSDIKRLRIRYRLVRDLLTSQLLFLCKSEDPDAYPSVPTLIAGSTIGTPAPKIPTFLQSFLGIAGGGELKLKLLGLITDQQQAQHLKDMLPGLETQIDDLARQSKDIRESGFALLDGMTVDGLLMAKSDALRQAMQQLVPILDTDLLTSKLAGLLATEASIVVRLLNLITSLDKDGVSTKALALLTNPDLLGSESGKAIENGQFDSQIRILFKLDKAVRLLGSLHLTSKQLDWIGDGAFDALRLNDLPTGTEPDLTFDAWRSLCDLVRVRDSVAGDDETLDELAVALRAKPVAPAKLEATLAKAYALDPDQAGQAADRLGIRNETSLRRPAHLLRWIELLHLLKLLGTRVDTLGQLVSAAPSAACAMAARKLFMAQFDAETLPKRLQPVSDKLRVRQRDALIAYLTHRDQLPDENALLDYYLIDAKMEPCMRTSRLKQAISSVQLYIQRCLLNLEKQARIPVLPSDINTTQWRWMKNYRVWEANRKVFLYPENWIEPDLRDDKTELFRTLEAELLDEELTHEKALAAFGKYVENAADLAKLVVLDLECELAGTDKIIHFLAVDQGMPRNAYYRSLRFNGTEPGALYWTPWEKVDGEIAGEHALIFKVGPYLHIAYPVLSSDDEIATRKVGLAVRRRTRDGWTRAKQSVQFLRMAVHPNKSPSATLVFNKRQAGDVKHPVALIDLYAPRRLEKLVATAIGGVYEMFTSDDKNQGFQKVELHIRVLERFVDSLGNSFLQSTEQPIWVSCNLDRPVGDLPGPQDYQMGSSNGTYETKLDYITMLAVKFPDHDRSHDHAAWRCYSIQVIASGDPIKHIQPSITKIISTEKDQLGNSGRWDVDIVFDIKPEYSIEKLYPSERSLEDRLDSIGQFMVGKDLAISLGDNPDTSNRWIKSPLAFPDTEHYGPGFLRRADEKEGSPLVEAISIPNYGKLARRTILNKTYGRYFIVSGGQAVAYRDEHHALAMILGYPTVRVMSFGQDWAFDQGVEAIEELPNKLALQDLAPTQSDATSLELGKDARMTGSTDNKLVPVFDRTFPAAAYDWEAFFHIPLLVAVQLSQAQRFEEAQRWFHTIFDPTTNDPEPDESRRYWRFPKFREAGQGEGIDQLLEQLAVGAQTTLHAEIAAWKKDPFKPHLIARYRVRAYQWAVVMKYIDNLIAWGDQLFRRETIEAINGATQLYILAARILGRRPASVPRCQAQPRSFMDLAYGSAKGLDEFSNAWVALEDLGFQRSSPFSQYKPAIGPSGLYFCVPQNSVIEDLWDTVENRLFNIRHCRNIDGVERKLPLFEPPIDPALLVKAAAAGLDISAVLADLGAPLPLHRFVAMLPKALETCADVRALGSAVLQALEKKDAEDLALLRNSHEIALLRLTEQVKRRQIDEATLTIEGLEESRRTAEVRYEYYQRLLGRADVPVPKKGAVAALAPVLTALAKSGPEGVPQGLGISQKESGQLQLLRTAQLTAFASGVSSTTAGVLHAIGGILSALPRGSSPGLLLGDMGGPLTGAGHAANAIAGYLNTLSGVASSQAGMEGIVGGYERRRDDWILQSNLALREMAQIDKQWAAAEIRSQIAEKELDNTRKQIDNARSIDEFMKSKYSNAELYRYMSNALASLYFRTYQLALDVAKRAQRCFQFELGQPNASFIEPGYWNSARKGLLSGEQLHHDLRRMELAYMESLKRDYEITKHVSLLQIEPLALIALRQNGRCEFTVPEAFYDLDCPGHYQRRIKSVSITIPCVTGPYAGVHCTLTLLSSSVRQDAGGGGATYMKSVDVDDPRFRDDYSSIQSIVTSGAQGDTGLFETNLRDERYLPFEGAGAISTWRLELPSEFRQFDYKTISDVILHIRYTAREGGSLLRQGAINNLKNPIARAQAAGSVRLFSIREEFPTEWAKFRAQVQAQEPSAQQRFALELPLRAEHFPFWSKGHLARVTPVEIVARSGKQEVPQTINVFDKLDKPGNPANCYTLTKAVAMGNLLIGTFASTPPAPTVDVNTDLKLFFDDNDLSDLWVALTWGNNNLTP